MVPNVFQKVSNFRTFTISGLWQLRSVDLHAGQNCAWKTHAFPLSSCNPSKYNIVSSLTYFQKNLSYPKVLYCLKHIYTCEKYLYAGTHLSSLELQQLRWSPLGQNRIWKKRLLDSWYYFKRDFTLKWFLQSFPALHAQVDSVFAVKRRQNKFKENVTFGQYFGETESNEPVRW